MKALANPVHLAIFRILIKTSETDADANVSTQLDFHRYPGFNPSLSHQEACQGGTGFPTPPLLAS
jgi:hypothetical protein